MSTVTTNDGVTIFYKDWGPKNAHRIVFHHGWPLSADDRGFPHGMCTTHADVVNPELLAFIKS